mmetsp:Transcript_35561/g.86067  ORF Transcript_35561/g.86067 Transcript_35561/m.86067 type:complete len:654 (-) Transcript_35561:76-2037(-)
MGFFRRKHLKQATAVVDDGHGFGYSSAANEQLMTVNDVDDGHSMNDWHQDEMEYGRMANYHRGGGGGGGGRETASVASKSVGEALAPKDQFDLYIPMRETVKPKATTKPSKLGSKIKNDKRGIKGAALDETSTASSITCATRDFVISPSKKKSPRNKASTSRKMNMKQQSRRLENITELNEANDEDNEVSNNNIDRYESDEGRNGRPNVVGNDALYGPTTLDPPAIDPLKMSDQNRQQAVDSAVLSIEESMRKLDADTKKIGQSLTLAKQKRQQYQQQLQQRQRKQQNQVDGFEMEQRQEKNANNVRARRPSPQRSDGQYHTDPPVATFELIDGNKDTANVPHETMAVDPIGEIMHVTSTPVVSTVDPTNPTGLGQLLSLATKCFIANPNRVKEQVPMTIVPDCTPRPGPQQPGGNLSTPPPPSSLMQFQREASGIRGADFVVGTQFFSQRAGVELKDEAQVGDNVLLDYAEEADIIVPTPLPLMDFVDDGRDDDGDKYYLRDNEYSVAVNFGYGEDYDDYPVGPGKPKDRSERVARPPTKLVGDQNFTPPRLSKNRSLPKIPPPQLNHVHQQRHGTTKNSNANDNSSKRSSSINGRTTRGSSTTKTNTTSSGSHHQKRFGRRTRSGLRNSRGYRNKTPGGGVKIDDPAELFS